MVGCTVKTIIKIYNYVWLYLALSLGGGKGTRRKERQLSCYPLIIHANAVNTDHNYHFQQPEKDGRMDSQRQTHRDTERLFVLICESNRSSVRG